MFVGWQLLQEEILLKECQIGVTSNACQPRLNILASLSSQHQALEIQVKQNFTWCVDLSICYKDFRPG